MELSKKASEMDSLQGSVYHSPHSNNISIALDTLDIEFVLPMTRAGPLVVPYVNYLSYYK